MTDTPSSILLLRLQSTGSNTNLWGGYLNTALSTIEQAAKGYQALPVTGDATISWTNYSTGNSLQCALIKLTGTLSASATLTAPAYNNFVLVYNATGQIVTLKCSGGTGVSIPNGRKTLLYCDGTDYASATATWTNDSTALANSGDFVTYQSLAAAIAVLLSGTVTGLILNSAADTTPSYLGLKVTQSLSGLTTTQVAGLSSFQISTKNVGGNEKQKFSAGQGYVDGWLPGGTKAVQFTPVVGTDYLIDCSSSGVTVNLTGMTTPQVDQRFSFASYGGYGAFLLGTVVLNGVAQTNLQCDAGANGVLRYTPIGWN